MKNQSKIRLSVRSTICRDVIRELEIQEVIITDDKIPSERFFER
jgi:hypothetical protein